ncbi:MAG: GNAT family N-acetyltransferase [Jiangellaceae bacterium]
MTNEMTPTTVTTLTTQEHLDRAARLAAVAMSDNPLPTAVLGDDRARRVEVLRRTFTAMFQSNARTVLGAWREGHLLAIAAYAVPGRCQPTPAQMTGFLPALLRAGIRGPRMLRWQRAWGRHDPGEPHSHLGPVAVTAEHRGAGVGSLLVGTYVAEIDANHQVGYLETDKVENLRLYRRFAFEVVVEQDVVRVPNWFMVRPRQV